MAIQSAVRCVETVPVKADEATAIREDSAGRMDAAACIQALELELALAPFAVPVHRDKARARFWKRARLAMMFSGLAILIGGLAGTLTSL